MTDIAQDKDANKKYYFAVIKADERDYVLQNIAAEGPEIWVWQKGMSEKKVETYEIINFDPKSNELNLKSKASLLSKLTKSSLVDKHIFLKMKFDKYQYFTTSTLTFDAEENLYKVNISDDLYISQQRSDYRLQANRYNVMKLRIDGDLFDCLDLSSGGTSFQVPQEDKDRFAKDKVFEKCRLQFDNQAFDIPKAKIAAQFPKDGEDGTPMIGLGIQFMDLSEKTDEELCRMVHTEARAEEVRKTLLNKKS